MPPPSSRELPLFNNLNFNGSSRDLSTSSDLLKHNKSHTTTTTTTTTLFSNNRCTSEIGSCDVTADEDSDIEKTGLSTPGDRSPMHPGSQTQSQSQSQSQFDNRSIAASVGSHTRKDSLSSIDTTTAEHQEEEIEFTV
ncbi:hypothetical protein ScalyP_jg3565 [Parmales sp. scaly parma]|nr:hypothetical protein ScalyP_jg3565 [Parmales sp. scaly parma]